MNTVIPAGGEIAPLPGFNQESLQAALKAVGDLRFAVKNTTIPDHLEELSGGFAHWLGPHKLPSSVQCGVESALLNLIAHSRDLTLARLISDSPSAQIAVNGLISARPDELDSEIERITSAGYRAVKIKIGREDTTSDIALVRRIVGALPSGIAVRLDANRAWEFDEAICFARGINDLALAYIEEPLADPSRLPEFASLTGLPIALDESLRECDPDTIPHLAIAAAAIIRPGQLGGLERAMRYARRVQAAGLLPVVSSNVESAVGIAVLASMAATITPKSIPVGLDTLSWFREQPIELPITEFDSRIDIEVADRNARTICKDRLECLTDG